MTIKCEDLIKGITTEELVEELNRRKELEVDKQITAIRKAINTLKKLGVRVVESDGRCDYIDIDYEDEAITFQFEL